MVTVVTRAGKGSALTHGEMDANINNLNIGKFASVPATTSGTNTVTVSDDPTEGAYETNHVYEYQIGGTNTGAVTLAIDGLAATAVQTVAGDALVGGELVDGQTALFLYNGTNFRLLNPWAPSIHIYAGTTAPVAVGQLDIATDVTESTFESVGKTGSGATNIWTALDSISSTATAVMLNVEIGNTNEAGNFLNQVSFRPTGTSWSEAQSSQIEFVTSADAGTDDTSHIGFIIVPLNSSQQFDVTWTSAAATVTATLTYLGYCG